jgi:hypothetical protein
MKIKIYIFGNLQKLELLEIHLFNHGIMSQMGVAQSCMHPTIKRVCFIHSIVGEAKLMI